jgi:hypothetical protein
MGVAPSLVSSAAIERDERRRWELTWATWMPVLMSDSPPTWALCIADSTLPRSGVGVTSTSGLQGIDEQRRS